MCDRPSAHEGRRGDPQTVRELAEAREEIRLLRRVVDAYQHKLGGSSLYAALYALGTWERAHGR